MVIRRRLRTVLQTLALYSIVALVIGYFGVNAYSGNHGLNARQELDRQIEELTRELDDLALERGRWERRLALLKSEGIDPDMLDERARVLLGYVHPRDLVLMIDQP
jgi:cell division protein FtsB